MARVLRTGRTWMSCQVHPVATGAQEQSGGFPAEQVEETVSTDTGFPGLSLRHEKGF